MADTIRSLDYFLNPSTGALKDNTSGDITPQVVRDLTLSVFPNSIPVVGADPTGAADGATAFQAALDAADAAGIGFVTVPAGTFKIDTGLTGYPNVCLVGAGQGSTTIRAGDDITLLTLASTADDGQVAYGFGLRDLTLDGNGVGLIGLQLQRVYQWVLDRVRVRRFVEHGVKLLGACVGNLNDCNLTENAVGIYGTTHNNGTNTWFSNLVNIKGGRHEFNTDWVAVVNNAGLWNFDNANLELNGTDADDSTGVIKVTNACAAGEGIALKLQGCWLERNQGFAAVHFASAGSHDARVVVRDSLIRFPGSGDLKYGVYVNGGGSYRQRLSTENTRLDDATIEDVYLSGSNAHWERGPGEEGSVDYSLGHTYDWGRTATNNPASGLETWIDEDFDGVTAPALPAVISGDTDAGIVTSASSPIEGTNSLTTSGSVLDTSLAFYNADLDGNSGDVKASCDVIVPTAETPYSEVRLQIRAKSQAAGADGYFVVVAQSGGTAPTFNVYSNPTGGTGAGALTTERSLAVATKYRISVQAIGSTVKAFCQRASDGQWLKPDGTFQSGVVEFYTATNTDVAGEGYVGGEFYRQAGGSAVIKVDNWLVEKYIP